MAGGAKQQQPSTTTTQQVFSPEDAARRAKLMAEAERVYGITSGVAASGGPAGPSGDTLQAQQLARQTAGSNPLAGQADQLGWAQNFGLQQVLNPTQTPGFQDALNTATRKVGESFTAPGGVFSNIRSSFTGGNTAGTGSREGIAMGMAGRDYLNTIGDVTGRMTMGAYDKGLDTFARTLALTPQTQGAMMTAEMTPSNILGALGQQTEGYQNQQTQWDLSAPWAAMGPYANVISGTTNPGTVTNATTPGAQPASPANMMLSGALAGSAIKPGWGTAIGAGAGLLLSLFS